MVWECPHLHSFWSEAFKLIAKITGVIVRPSIEKAILIIDMSEYPLMMSKWKTNETPTLRELTTKVNIVAEYEKILAYRDGSNAKYVSNWYMWNSLNCLRWLSYILLHFLFPPFFLFPSSSPILWNAKSILRCFLLLFPNLRIQVVHIFKVINVTYMF